MILTIFYDGQCPLCLAEIRQLKSLDTSGQLAFVDLNTDQFNKHYPHISKTDALKILHAELYNGEIIHGLDVTHHAWSLVGKHRWISILRWPLIKPVADAMYRLFARYRNTIAFWLTGKSRCSSCSL